MHIYHNNVHYGQDSGLSRYTKKNMRDPNIFLIEHYENHKAHISYIKSFYTSVMGSELLAFEYLCNVLFVHLIKQ